MIFPNFLSKNDLIGLTALSGGCNSVILELKTSINHLKENYNVILTPNCYGDYIVSSSIEVRLKELNDLLNKDIKMLFPVRGGDFLWEIIPYINYDLILNKRLLVQGYSDISTLLYILTTKYDLATIYGGNGKSFDNLELLPYQLVNLEYMKGNFIKQESYMDRNTISVNGNFKDSGILIGGCLDVLRFIIGTSFDNTLNFIDKYKDYNIIWYFDIYSMDSLEVYFTLMELNNIGWFKYTNTIIFGSILSPSIECNFSYIDGFKKLFPNLNIIVDANIGHIDSVFTIVNGALGKVEFIDNKLIIEMEKI